MYECILSNENTVQYNGLIDILNKTVTIIKTKYLSNGLSANIYIRRKLRKDKYNNLYCICCGKFSIHLYQDNKAAIKRKILNTL